MGTLIKVLTMCIIGTVAVGAFWLCTLQPTTQPERAQWSEVAKDYKRF